MKKDIKIFLMKNDLGMGMLDVLCDQEMEYEYAEPNASYGFTIAIEQIDFNLLKVLLSGSINFKPEHDLGYYILHRERR